MLNNYYFALAVGSDPQCSYDTSLHIILRSQRRKQAERQPVAGYNLTGKPATPATRLPTRATFNAHRQN